VYTSVALFALLYTFIALFDTLYAYRDCVMLALAALLAATLPGAAILWYRAFMHIAFGRPTGL
jgi:hypothetical protein